MLTCCRAGHAYGHCSDFTRFPTLELSYVYTDTKKKGTMRLELRAAILIARGRVEVVVGMTTGGTVLIDVDTGSDLRK